MDTPLVYTQDTSVFIDGTEYPLVTYGRQQAHQAQGLTRWASKYGQQVYDALQTQGNSGNEGGLEFLLKILDLLTEDAMIDLFSALLGCSKETSELYFDTATLIDAGIVVYEKHPTVRKLLDRFFSTSDSESDGQPASSMTSDQPTDGETN